MLYNLPPATGVNLEPDIVGALARQVEYIQVRNGDQRRHGPGRQADPPPRRRRLDIRRLGQPDAARADRGAAGVMSGVSNAIPHEMVVVHRALLAGDLKAARSKWAPIYPLVDSAMSARFLQAVKVATKARGLAWVIHPGR